MNDFYTLTHEITPQTLAVIAQQDEDGNLSTCVLEDETEYTVDYSPSKLIDFSCKFFGSSLKGRQDGTRDICGITHKAPISIDPSSGMYFFPTTSPSNPKCSWIAHTHIEKLNRAGNQCTEIVFKSGKKVTLDTSIGSLLNQVQRTAQFRYLLDNRIKYLKQHRIDQKLTPST
ncbi:competence protein [Ornithinibacillus sp. L9]|uniref:Competence protein n=2 Tax=Ornithinibacillus caprae TaxID=2678566 RepID=A0A6N8FQ74_9BACI|nr:competence protein [Ornithinibacillus caprae]